MTDAMAAGNEIRVILNATESGPAAGVLFWEDFADLGLLSAGRYSLFADFVYEAGTPFEATVTCGPALVVVRSAQPVPMSSGASVAFVLVVGAAGWLFIRFRS